MRILLVIDHFGSGGAQRQIVELARGLSRRGHSVEMFAYFPQHGFFRPRLDAERIVVHEYEKGRGFSLGVVRKIAALITQRNVDIVVSYLSSPNIYAELAKIIAPRAKLVVSERTSHLDDKSRVSAFLRRAMHALADHVVANSVSQTEWLRRKWWLKGKVSCIYNGLELRLFATERPLLEPGESLRLVAVGRIGAEKNAANLIRGLALFHREFGHVPQVSWMGEREGGMLGMSYCRQVDELLDSTPEVRGRWRWLDVASDVQGMLQKHHALIHPSFYEGLPNVVCEALAAGMPVLASDVCDHPRLVADGERGFLFDPDAPASIAAAIAKLVNLAAADWQRLSRNARQFAEAELDVERMVTQYEALFEQVLSSRHGTLA